MIRYLLLAWLSAIVLGTHAPQWVMILAATSALVNVVVALAHD